MYGLEAIAHNNGWVIALTGACIVFAGLSALVLVISQLHKVVALLDRPPKPHIEVVAEEKVEVPARPDCPSDINLAVQMYLPLVEELDPEFELADLYALARKYHLPHPHLSIRLLQEVGQLQPLGGGVFRFVA